MREAGVEPARPCEHWHLKPASLPIPPLARLAFGIGLHSLAQERYYHIRLSMSTLFSKFLKEFFWESAWKKIRSFCPVPILTELEAFCYTKQAAGSRKWTRRSWQNHLKAVPPARKLGVCQKACRIPVCFLFFRKRVGNGIDAGQLFCAKSQRGAGLFGRGGLGLPFVGGHSGGGQSAALLYKDALSASL